MFKKATNVVETVSANDAIPVAIPTQTFRIEIVAPDPAPTPIGFTIIRVGIWAALGYGFWKLMSSRRKEDE